MIGGLEGMRRVEKVPGQVTADVPWLWLWTAQALGIVGLVSKFD